MSEAGAYALAREMNAARALKESLADILRDDPDFFPEAVEGETNLLEMIDALVLSIRQDGALHAATADLAETLTARMERIEKRIGAKRALVLQAMELAEIQKRECPAGTVSTKAVPPKLEIVDSVAIPDIYWLAQPPKLDRKAVLADLKAGQTVPGAALSNGGRTIQVRS